jgi:hypothetical protein
MKMLLGERARFRIACKVSEDQLRFEHPLGVNGTTGNFN